MRCARWAPGLRTSLPQSSRWPRTRSRNRVTRVQVLAYMTALGYKSDHDCPDVKLKQWCERTMQFYDGRFPSFKDARSAPNDRHFLDLEKQRVR